jgi:hypothetical protein
VGRAPHNGSPTSCGTSFCAHGIVATTFSKWLDHLAQERERNSSAQARAVESVKEVTNLLYERLTRAVLLSSAIQREAREPEILARKAAYDDVYVRWNSTLLSNQFRMREISGSSLYSEYEGYFDSKMAPLLKAADKCLTAAFDTYLRRPEPAAVAPAVAPSSGFEIISSPGLAAKAANQQLLECKIDVVFGTIGSCSYTLADALYELVATRMNPPDVLSKLNKDCMMPR